ncbi:hypothetical protein PENDEC_c004G05500 [Penicillium decumbens]|uniref:Lysine-specific metallo-endopeptidase domain-containing protein n=1 Tax=Penicillium decumbens TaxID=69771 RepID=A0A1V6PIA6_PENDC|nr:hypothetical protein PENDEC_c004G05500 [Penicillium decumbens]
MGFGHPGRALLARIGQFLLLAQVLLTAQAHPFYNHSIAYTGEDNHSNNLVERASASEFTALSRNTKMLVHDSCTKRMNLQAWQTVLDALTVVAQHGQQTASVTYQIIDHYISTDNPTLNDDNRRMMDLFMTLYGSFKWDDVSAKNVARARAQRLSEIATIFANGLAKNTMHWRWMCDSKEWVVDPNNANAWMIKNMDLSPRGKKETSNICLMPANSNGVQRLAAAFVLDAPRDVANSQPDWITFCDGAWSELKYQMHQYLNQASVTKLHTEQSWIQSVIYNTWERLLAHELFHGKAAFGAYAGIDYQYGWNDIVQLAKDSNAETDVNEHKPLKNNDSFSYWLNGVYLTYCNFSNGQCKPISQPTTGNP